MKSDYYDFWKNRVVHSTKLEFFTSQKSIYSQERYLCAIKKIKYRQALSKLRLSNHSLNIEAERYKQPKIPRERRICFLCNLSKVETETHFLFECPAYDTQRQAFSKELERYSLEQLPNESSLKCFMETEQDQQLILLGKYIENLFKHIIRGQMMKQIYSQKPYVKSWNFFDK